MEQKLAENYARRFDIYIDESGNQGRGLGDYFTIAFFSGEHEQIKKACRTMRKSSLRIKTKYPTKYKKFDEVKAGNLDINDRKLVLKQILKADGVSIDYITVYKPQLKDSMYEHKHISYNYYCKFVLKKIFSRLSPSSMDDVYMHLDNRTFKVKSGNTFQDFMFEFIKIVNGWDCTLNIEYLESQSSYGVQCADFISNGINYYYLTGNTALVMIMKPKIKSFEHFPFQSFVIPENSY